MAIMSRRKQANKQGWETINKQRAEANKTEETEGGKKISEEEHQERVEMLKKIGLLKE
tara:strand:+ start:270 stop:443 length:174 start_codon:yes stop_codon:yes gene_type:complete